jgi:hypothetical protein
MATLTVKIRNESMRLAELLDRERMMRRQERTSVVPFFEKYIADANAQTERSALVMALLQLALASIESGQSDGMLRAKDLIAKAENLLNAELENDSVQSPYFAYLQYCQGVWELNHHNHDRALSLLQSAYLRFEANEDIEGMALADDALGLYCMTIGNFEMAQMHFERSLLQRQEMNDEHGKAISFGNLGRFHLQIEELEPVEDLFQTSLEIGVECEDEQIQIEALSGLAQYAIVRPDWKTAIATVQNALQLTQEPLDTKRVAYLWLYLAEALLGSDRLEESLKAIDNEVKPRFTSLQSKAGIAAAKHIRGKILYRRLIDGLDSLEQDKIEHAEDALLDAAMIFEQEMMPQAYAKTLYDLAYLYQLCLNSRFKYQYQGKSVRSLELALNALDQFNCGNTKLAAQIDKMLMQSMGGGF